MRVSLLSSSAFSSSSSVHAHVRVSALGARARAWASGRATAWTMGGLPTHCAGASTGSRAQAAQHSLAIADASDVHIAVDHQRHHRHRAVLPGALLRHGEHIAEARADSAVLNGRRVCFAYETRLALTFERPALRETRSSKHQETGKKWAREEEECDGPVGDLECFYQSLLASEFMPHERARKVARQHLVQHQRLGLVWFALIRNNRFPTGPWKVSFKKKTGRTHTHFVAVGIPHPALAQRCFAIQDSTSFT